MSDFGGSFHTDPIVYEFRNVASCNQRPRISGCTNFHANWSNFNFIKIWAYLTAPQTLIQTECKLCVTRGHVTSNMHCTSPAATRPPPAPTSLITWRDWSLLRSLVSSAATWQHAIPPRSRDSIVTNATGKRRTQNAFFRGVRIVCFRKSKYPQKVRQKPHKMRLEQK